MSQQLSRAMAESDPRCTIISVDGIGAFDLMSSSPMLEAMRLTQRTRGPSICPVVLRTTVETFVGGQRWSTTDQNEGEQGDAMMPLLFSEGWHAVLVAVQAQLRDGEKLFAFLNAVYVATPNPVTGWEGSSALLTAELHRRSGIRINGGVHPGVERSGCASMRL